MTTVPAAIARRRIRSARRTRGKGQLVFIQLTNKPEKKLESSTSEHAILVPHIYLREVASLSSPSLQVASACHGSLQVRYLDHALTAVVTYL